MGESLPYSGRYIRVEGPDGSGKTELITRAKTYANEHRLPVLFIREPGTGVFGEEIRNYLLHATEHSFSPQTEYALFTANRAHLATDVILPALQDGMTVISDRGIESSGAMQGGEAGKIAAAAKGWSNSLTTEEIFEIGRIMLPDFYMRPDGLVLLSLTKEVRRKRMQAKAASIGHDKIESRSLAYSDAVHDGYIAYETNVPYASVIDAEQSPQQVFDAARPILFGPNHEYYSN